MCGKIASSSLAPIIPPLNLIYLVNTTKLDIDHRIPQQALCFIACIVYAGLDIALWPVPLYGVDSPCYLHSIEHCGP